jgi:hypothetical protein
MSKNSPAAWPFADPPNVAVFTSKHVVRDRLPVLLVSHDDEDGAWQFHYGGVVDDADAMIVGLAEMLKRNPELAELSDLPTGWRAERKTAKHPWTRRQDVET